MRLRHMLAAGAAALAVTASAEAATIIGAVDATASTEAGPNFGIDKSIDQSGLSANYVSGTTNFADFVATTTHNPDAWDQEWYGAEVPTATGIYDLGAVYTLESVAIWVEEFAGFGTVDILGSIDGLSWTAMALGYVATDNAVGEDYTADVVLLDSRFQVRFVQLNLSGCPHPYVPEPGGPAPWNGCAVGEVAFGAVPLPASGLLLMTGLLGLGGYRRFAGRT